MKSPLSSIALAAVTFALPALAFATGEGEAGEEISATAAEGAAPASPETPVDPSATTPPGSDAGDDGVLATVSKLTESFTFGSYGRVPVGSNLRGGLAEGVALIAHPPRLLEAPYAELDLAYYYEVPDTGTGFRVQTTLALGEKLFHLDGDWDADIALRNLYVEVDDLIWDGFDVWAGSRMYRGDDIYLLDFWPLDEQNTVGLGAAYRFGETKLALHAGLNRLEDEYQTQYVTVPGETTGTREVLFLNRHRIVVSARGEHHFGLSESNPELKLKTVFYGESHAIPTGQLQTEDYATERLPADLGWLLGAEASLYGFAPASHVNLFFRWASGLAAYDELGIPYGLSTEKKAEAAQEVLIGLSANYQISDFGLLGGFYTRYFVDADPNVYDRDDGWEMGWAFRPAWFITEHFHLLAEANLQWLRPNGLSEVTARQDEPLVFELGIMPAVSLGKGSYARPQIRLIYAISLLNQAALDTFAETDPQRRHDVRHFLGVGVEWWFNSTRYPGGLP